MNESVQNVNTAGDTIAAISTGMVTAGIAVIRISGEDAVEVADRIFIPGGKKAAALSERPSHTLVYGKISEEGKVLDEVIVKLMRAPHSYTGEDVVEIDCHGGLFVVNSVLDAVIRAGARLAEPGEFTRRAFLNGKMDLSRAESVAGLIHAENELARNAAITQLSGKEEELITKIQKTLMDIMAFAEAALDDPEHISIEEEKETLTGNLTGQQNAVRKLVGTYDQGRLITEGVRTVICGKPNAGKSSLLNALLHEERSIVTDIAGTTRDTIDGKVNVGPLTLHLIDTAGVNRTDDPVEAIGVERTLIEIDKADLILFMVDGHKPLDHNDEQIIKAVSHKNVIVMINKSDLEQAVEPAEVRQCLLEVDDSLSDAPIVEISALYEQGLEKLAGAIEDRFFSADEVKSQDMIIVSKRHEQALRQADQALERALDAIRSGLSEEFWLLDVREAYDRLGMITGTQVGENLIDEIFSQFCMGK